MLILKKHWKKSIIVFLIVLSACLYHHYYIKKAKPPKKSEATLVRLSRPSSKFIPNQLIIDGKIVAEESTNISSKVSGYITEIHYTEGAAVSKGTTLIQLDNRKEQNDVIFAKANANINHFKYEQNAKLYKNHIVAYIDLYNAKVNQEQSDANLMIAQTNLAQSTITAPFSGTLGAKIISVGDYITPGKTLATLTNLDQLKIIYFVPARYINQLRLGQSVNIQNHTATVSYLAPSVDADSQMLEVHAKIDNHDHVLKPGEFVQVVQQLGPPKPALMIPKSSVLMTLNGNSVFVIKNHQAQKQPVQLGRQLDQWVEVLHGLGPNDDFVVQGQTELLPNMPVVVQP